MECFKVVTKIKYQTEIFYVLLNRSCQKYFVKELPNGTIMYPTVREWDELTKIFNQKQALFDLKIGQDYNVEPRLISKGGKVIALALVVASLTFIVPGSSLQRENSAELENQAEGSATTENWFEDGIRKKGYDFHSLYGYEEERIYRIHQYPRVSSNTKVIECQNFEEFSKYINTKAKPTFDDVKETLMKNSNILEKYKQWLLEGIENLQKYMPNLDLTVLNYNFSRLQIEETTEEEMKKDKETEQLVGVFNPETGKTFFIDAGDDDYNKFILYHEILGHGISEAVLTYQKDDNEEKIIISDSIFAIKVFDQENEIGRNYHAFYIGQGLEEGKADQIAKYAMGQPKIAGHVYIEQSEQLRIMCETVGLTLEEYISNGGAEILSQRMQQNGIVNSLMYIVSNDIYVSAMKSDSLELLEEKDSFKSNIIEFFKDYAEHQMQAGVKREDIIAKFSKILARGGKLIHSTFNGEEIDYLDFANHLEESMFDEERDD